MDDDNSLQVTRKSIMVVLSSYITLIKFRLPLCRRLAVNNDVTIVLPEKDKASVDCSMLPGELKVAFVDMDRSSQNLFKLLGSFVQTCSILHKRKPDLVLAFTMKPIVLVTLSSFLVKYKFISMFTGMGEVFVGKNKWKVRIFKVIISFVIRRATQVWVTNTTDQQLIGTLAPSFESKVKNVHGCGVDFNYFSHSQSAKMEVHGMVKVGFFARIIKSKGIVEFVQAAKELLKNDQYQNVSFHIFGFFDADSKSHISREDLEVDDIQGICIEGFSDDVRADMDEMDIICLPSYREGLPTTLVEAAALEKMIVTTAVAGCTDVVTHMETGLLATPRCSQDLQKNLQVAIDMGYERRKLFGIQARAENMQKYDQINILNQQNNLIEIVLNAN